MAAPLNASMPQFTQLGVNARIDVEALDPVTGAAVSGVVISNVDVFADVLDAPTDTANLTGAFMLVHGPSFTPQPTKGGGA